METINLTCIICPIGCPLTVIMDDKKIISVTGNTCIRGEKYAHNECLSPKRTLTTTIKLDNKNILSVKSNSPLPKENLLKYMDIIKKAVIMSPVFIGDIVIKNIDNTNVDIVATKNVE